MFHILLNMKGLALISMMITGMVIVFLAMKSLKTKAKISQFAEDSISISHGESSTSIIDLPKQSQSKLNEAMKREEDRIKAMDDETK